MADLSKWEPTIQNIIGKLRNTLSDLNAIWEEIGYPEEVQSAYFKQASEYIEELLQEMVSEAETRRDALLQNIKELMQQIATLCSELGNSVEIAGYENFSLREVEQVLLADLEKLEYCKEQRLAHLKELLIKEKSICKALGVQPIGVERLPSEEELNSFKLYLEKQEEEKNRLEAIFKEMRKAIIKMMDDLGITPTCHFEQIVYTDTDNFVFTGNNMTKLRELRDQLKVQVNEAREHVEELKQELIAIWKYLDEPEHICQSFLNSYVDCSVSTINALSAELNRCKEKRRQNICRYVSEVRNELIKLWDLCKYSKEQRKQFIHFNSQTYTEDLLTLHELEVKKVQEFYEANKPIFELLEERENLWTKMKELLQRANDPDRFYNRGGQLLTEEKERKTIQKKLPKIEEELKNLIKEYEAARGEPFTLNGMLIEDLLKESWENLHEQKETIKKARKGAKDKNVKKITLSASKKAILSASKKTPTALTTTCRNTPLSTTKRKLLYSPSPNSSAKRKNMSVVTIGPKIRRSGKVSRRLIQTGNRSMKSGQKKENSMSQSSAATDTTYNQFKQHLEDRRELRSSLLPDQVLANASTSKMKTPVRTPAKPLRKNLLLTPSNSTPKLSQSQALHKSPRSPRIAHSSKLAAVTTDLPIIF